ncbi:MAG TPA: DUF3566 domain-containing protein [bacterium]|nr:DUF3566 domain-containing protein [bacterium]
MRVQIKRFDITSVVKISFVIYAILGMVVGLIYVLVAVLFGSLLDLSDAFQGTELFRIAATGIGILLVPLFGVLYGVIGALGGLLGAAVYNLISKALGGVKLDLEMEGTEGSPPGLNS